MRCSAVDLQQRRHLCRVVVLVRPLEPEARIAHHQADIHRLRRLGDGLNGIGVRKIDAAQRHANTVGGRQLRSQGLQTVAAPRNQQQVAAAFSQTVGKGLPDAG